MPRLAPRDGWAQFAKRPPSLPLSLLRFSWGRYACLGVTVPEIISQPEVRPDSARILKIRSVGLIDQAAAALSCLMAKGDCA